jgi:hypothetical protein
MKSFVKVALVTLALAGGSLAVGMPAQAADHVEFSLGNIAFGYSDGYWDQSRHWHAWRKHSDAVAFRQANADHYYARKHTADKAKGWRDSDRYWEHH